MHEALKPRKELKSLNNTYQEPSAKDKMHTKVKYMTRINIKYIACTGPSFGAASNADVTVDRRFSFP